MLTDWQPGGGPASHVGQGGRGPYWAVQQEAVVPARVTGMPAVQPFQPTPQLSQLGLGQQGNLGVSALSGPLWCPGC